MHLKKMNTTAKPNIVHVLMDMDFDAIMAVSNSYADLIDYWTNYLVCETDYLSFEIDELTDKMQNSDQADSYRIIKCKTAEPLKKGMIVYVAAVGADVLYIGTSDKKAYKVLRDYLITDTDYDVEEMTEILNAVESGELTGYTLKTITVI